jgi:PAS domain S-box-containing protein
MLIDESVFSKIERYRFIMEDIPTIVYFISRDGRFIDCNRRCRDFLGLPSDIDGLNIYIQDFILDSAERSSIIHEVVVSEFQNRRMKDLTITFKVGGILKKARVSCSSIKNHINKHVAFWGCVTDITEEEDSYRLFQEIPAGVYLLDADDNIVSANAGFARLLGFNTPEEVINKNISVFYPSRDFAIAFRGEVISKRSISKNRIKLIRNDGESVYCSASIVAVYDQDVYMGRRGVLVDTTREERYRSIIDSMPIGTYTVRSRNNMDILIDCNDYFSQLHGYDNAKELLDDDKRIVSLLSNPETDYPALLLELKDISRSTSLILGKELKVKSRSGEPFIIEAYIKPIRSASGRLLGSSGVVRNISQEVALRQIRDEMAVVLHTIKANINKMAYAFITAKEVLSTGLPALNDPALIDNAIDILSPSARDMVLAMSHLLDQKDISSHHVKAFSEDDWNQIARDTILLLEGPQAAPEREGYPSFLDEIAVRTIGIVKNVCEGHVQKEVLKDVVSRCMEERRRHCYILVSREILSLTEIAYPLDALRNLVLSSEDIFTIFERVDFIRSLNRAIYDISDYATQRAVRVKKDIHNADVFVMAHEASLVRAISNILHNAVKYSWKRVDGTTWINISARIVGKYVQLEVTNWGVPIEERELKEGWIFIMGKRGRLSRDRGRVGTGVGLADVKRTVEKYGGTLVLESKPAAKTDKSDYRQPFVTTATIRMPTGGTGKDPK